MSLRVSGGELVRALVMVVPVATLSFLSVPLCTRSFTFIGRQARLAKHGT